MVILPFSGVLPPVNFAICVGRFFGGSGGALAPARQSKRRARGAERQRIAAG